MNPDEDLRRAFTAPGGRAPRPEDCPEPATIWAAVHGELPPKELREVVDHTATCGACAEDWRLAVEADREDVADLDDADDPVEANEATAADRLILFPRRWARFAPLVAAAAAIVLLVVGLPFVQQRSDTKRGNQLESLVENGTELPREDCLLRWSGPPDATYQIEVRTPSGQSLDSARGIRVQRYTVPKAKLTGIPPKTKLTWEVTATLPGRSLHFHSTFKIR